MKKHGIEISYANDGWLTAFAKRLLMSHYSRPGDISPQDIFARAAVCWSTYRGYTDLEMAQFLYDAINKRWFMFASPLMSNTPDIAAVSFDGSAVFGKSRGLPISCFLGYVPDTIPGLIEHTSEFRMMSVMGGGYGGHWEDVRSVSDKSPGPIPFICTLNSDVEAYRQGSTRKGSYAAYLNVTHPDIIEFLTVRVPTGGDVTRKALDIHTGVCIPDSFMECVCSGSMYELIDPKSGPTGKTLDARMVWRKLLEIRDRVGESFLWFIDAANRNLPQSQRDLGLKNHGSNLCTEIALATNEERTAVCCLSSVNVEMFEEWKDTKLVEYMVRMLDNVLEYFISRAKDNPYLKKAVFSAESERAIGIGRMGFANYLMSQGVPYESQEAQFLNMQVTTAMEEAGIRESKRLALERGEPADMKGTGLRSSFLFAVAPNANSALLMGTSPADEPMFGCLFSQRTRGGIIEFRNKYLEEELQVLGMNTDEVWKSIADNDGSVQHLDLPEHIKEVFKTAFEIDQRWVVLHAANRQRSRGMQAQSVNLFFNPGAEADYVENVHRLAWELNLLSLYYYRSRSSVRADSLGGSHEEFLLPENTPDITIIGRVGCTQCDQAALLLESFDVVYNKVGLDESGLTLAELTGNPGVRSLPAVLYRGAYLGGLNELRSHLVEADAAFAASGDTCLGCQG